MPDVELHIHVTNAGSAEVLGRLIEEAIARNQPEPVLTVPAGYRCTYCDAADGSHETGCQVPNLPQA